MFDRTYTRRAMLRRSLATAGAGAIIGAAGCSSLPNPLGGGASYANWLPVPDDVSDSDHYSFSYINMNAVESNEDAFDDDSVDPSTFEGFWDPLDLDWEDTSSVITLGFGRFGFGGLVVEADYNRDDQISELEDEDYDEDSEYEGFTIMLSENEERAIALNGNAAVLTSATDSSGDTGDTDRVEAVIDAKRGNEDRYGDDSEDMSLLLDRLGGGTFVNGRTMEESDDDNPEGGRFDAMVARGSRTKVNGETAKQKWVVVYDSEDDVDTGDLEDWVDENDGGGDQFDDVSDLSYNQNGRTGIITGTVDTDEI